MVVVCHVKPVGKDDDVLVVMAYSADCPVVVGVRVTAPTVMLFWVGVPLTAGVDTVAPSPDATALVSIVPETATAAVAPVTFACATVAGLVIAVVVVLAVVGVPVMLTVTVVPLVREAVAAVNPAGSPETAKFAAVMLVANVPLVSV